MNRTNLILIVVLGGMLGIWAMQGGLGGSAETTVVAPRMFPKFNKEAVDRIEIEGGWAQTKIVYERPGGEWLLASAGGYPVKQDIADRLLDAVYNMRAENNTGSSAALRESTRTGEQGRLVKLYSGTDEVAAFRVGGNPKGSYQHFFVSKEGEDDVYRTRTILTKDRNKAPDPSQPWSTGSSGFAWNNYIQNVGDWVKSEIWNLGDIDATAVHLKHGDVDAVMKKTGPDEWEILTGGKEPQRADTDAVDSLVSRVKYLSLMDVVGLKDEVGAEWGMDEPSITIAITARRVIESEDADEGDGEGGDAEDKDSGDTEDGDSEDKDGDDKDGDDKDSDDEKKPDKKEPEPKYETLRYVLTVGKKILRPHTFDFEEGKADEKEFYAITISSDPQDPENGWREKYVFLVRDWALNDIDKKLDDLILKEEEEEEEKDESPDGAEKEDAAEKTDEAADESGDKPDESGDGEEKEADGDDPKKSEKSEPENTEPEKSDPEQTEPEKTEPTEPEPTEPKKTEDPSGDPK